MFELNLISHVHIVNAMEYLNPRNQESDGIADQSSMAS